MTGPFFLADQTSHVWLDGFTTTKTTKTMKRHGCVSFLPATTGRQSRVLPRRCWPPPLGLKKNKSNISAVGNLLNVSRRGRLYMLHHFYIIVCHMISMMQSCMCLAVQNNLNDYVLPFVPFCRVWNQGDQKHKESVTRNNIHGMRFSVWL